MRKHSRTVSISHSLLGIARYYSYIFSSLKTARHNAEVERYLPSSCASAARAARKISFGTLETTPLTLRQRHKLRSCAARSSRVQRRTACCCGRLQEVEGCPHFLEALFRLFGAAVVLLPVRVPAQRLLLVGLLQLLRSHLALKAQQGQRCRPGHTFERIGLRRGRRRSFPLTVPLLLLRKRLRRGASSALTTRRCRWIRWRRRRRLPTVGGVRCPRASSRARACPRAREASRR